MNHSISLNNSFKLFYSKEENTMKERLLKATPNVLSTVDMIILVLKKVVNKNDTTIISTNSGRGFNVFFTINSVGYQISVDTDIDTIEFGIITDCRYLVSRETVSNSKAFELSILSRKLMPKAN